MKEEFVKLAKLAKTDPKVIEGVSLKMGKITGKANVMEEIVADIEAKTAQKLKELNLENPKAEQVFNALLNKLKEHDQKLFEHFKKPDFNKIEGYRAVLSGVKEIVGEMPGLYIKKEPALKLFRKSPPRKIMGALGYTDLEKMLAQEDWFELFAALRVVEDQDWVNKVFFAPYGDVAPEDFEQRDIKMLVMPEKWAKIAAKFQKTKLHHMSHLKELGLVFVIPMGASGASGELIYLFFMTMHYLHEVSWHSKLFEGYSRDKDFAQKIINALKVKTSRLPLPNEDKMSFRIVPAYLAKHDPNDWRLKEPRINPEAWHYTKTAYDIKEFARSFPEAGLGFWDDTNYVAKYFPDQNGETLISFNLFDTGIALLKRAGFEAKYLYHQQEALWNEIFIRYMGQQALDKAMMENLDKGLISL